MGLTFPWKGLWGEVCGAVSGKCDEANPGSASCIVFSRHHHLHPAPPSLGEAWIQMTDSLQALAVSSLLPPGFPGPIPLADTR